jgi:hypothetical protein
MATIAASDSQPSVRIGGLSVPVQLIEVRGVGGVPIGRLTLTGGDTLHFEGDAAKAATTLAGIVLCDAAAQSFLAALVAQYKKG